MSFVRVVKGSFPSFIRRWLTCENSPQSKGLASEVPPDWYFIILVPLLLGKMTSTPVLGSASEHTSGHARLGSLTYNASAANPFWYAGLEYASPEVIE